MDSSQYNTLEYCYKPVTYDLVNYEDEKHQNTQASYSSFLTLTQNEIIKATFIFTGINLLVFSCFRSYVFDTKKLSWGLTLVNSFFMSVIGIVYIIENIPSIVSIVSTGNGGRELLHSVDDGSYLVCLWFAIVNALDLLLGFIYYREFLGFFTAIVHHPFYIWVMIVAMTGNGGFIQMQPFANSFLLVCVEELPTFILALGTMIPAFRTDIGFGLSFFLIRICYHLFVLYLVSVSNLETASFVIPSISFAMNSYWFLTWVNKYGRQLFLVKK